MKVRYAGLLSGASLIVIAYATGAYAQSAPTSDNIEEVVVTGSLIRDITPPGGEVVSVTAADVTAMGVSSTNELLANIPQLGGANGFNGVPHSSPTGAANKIQVAVPDLHGLDNSNTSSGAGTLVLVDGHRIVSAGVTQDTPDPDVVPPGVIERVELLTDGGSATYGADAVSGVINFITKSHVDGVQADARYDTGDNYYGVDSDLTVGKDWGSGSAYVSYSFNYSSDLFGHDRDYAKDRTYSRSASGVLSSVLTQNQCATPNIVVGADTYALPGKTLGSENRCDDSKLASLFPSDVHHGIFAGFTQNITHWLTFDVTGFYSRRTETGYSGYVSQDGGVQSSTIMPSNPYYQNLVGTPDAGKNQTVQFNFQPAFGNKFGRQTNNLAEFGVTPTLTADLGHTWEVRAMFNYGRSVSSYYQQSVSSSLVSAAAAGTTTATALDPYDITNTNSAVLDAMGNYQSSGIGRAGLINSRIVADGELFQLPAGAIHAAVGGELITNSFSNRIEANIVHGAPITDPFGSYTQRDKALFAELEVPFFGDGFALPGIHSFDVSASLRYDDYSDFGVTYNPKVGGTWKPVDWVAIKANWGTSFQAPTPVTELGAQTRTIASIQYPLVPPGETYVPGSYLLFLSGSAANIQPQTAQTRSFGIDVTPPFVPGLTGSAEYYYISYKGILGNPPITSPASASIFFPNYPQDFIYHPTAAQLTALISAKGNVGGAAAVTQAGGTVVNGTVTNVGNIFEIIDYLMANQGNARQAGLDWSVGYTHDTGFGSVDANLSANLALENFQNSGRGSAFKDLLDTGSAFHYSLTVGANIGKLRAQATLNHSQGYHLANDIDSVTNQVIQSHIDSFNVINLFFNYDLSGAGICDHVDASSICENAALTLNVNNVFDQSPPVYLAPFGLGASPGYANGATLGRVFEIGISKKF